MSDFSLKSFGLKIVVNKPKQKRVHSDIIKFKTLFKGVVVLEDNTYKVIVKSNINEVPNNIIIPFTDNSYILKGKRIVFQKSNTSIAIIRDKWKSIFSPGLSDFYIPFAPKWVVDGYIIKNGDKYMFDFRKLVTISGYDITILEE